MCLRPERIKMPGSHPQAAQTPGELGLDISFQTSGDAGLSISPFAHTTTYFVYEFCLPGFQHERYLNSHWRRSKLRPLQQCQEWNWRSEQRQGSDLPSYPLESLPSHESTSADLPGSPWVQGWGPGATGYSGLPALSFLAGWIWSKPVFHFQSLALASRFFLICQQSHTWVPSHLPQTGSSIAGRGCYPMLICNRLTYISSFSQINLGTGAGKGLFWLFCWP